MEKGWWDVGVVGLTERDALDPRALALELSRQHHHKRGFDHTIPSDAEKVHSSSAVVSRELDTSRTFVSICMSPRTRQGWRGARRV